MCDDVKARKYVCGGGRGGRGGGGNHTTVTVTQKMRPPRR